MSKFDEQLFGRIAVLGGHITKEELDACLADQHERSSPTFIGQVLLERECLSAEQLKSILSIRRQKVRKLNLTHTDAVERDREFARLALRENLVDLDQLEDAVLEQQLLRGVNLHFTLGEVFISRGEVESRKVLRVLAIQGRRMLCCPVCDRHYRIPEFRENREGYQCPKCSSPLTASRFLDDQLADGVLEAGTTQAESVTTVLPTEPEE
jgi:hypothetical protein